MNERQEAAVPAELRGAPPAAGLAPHQQRMVDERTALADRAAKLDEFITGDRFSALGRPDKMLLLRQHAAMTWYLETLDHRIARFGQPGSAA